MNIVVLGGGISALSAAWYAKKRHPDAKVIVLEKESSLGGWMQTRSEQGFLFEKGPRTLQMARSPHLISLIEEAGLGGEMIVSDPSAAQRFILHRGCLRSLRSFWPLIGWAFCRSLVAKKGSGEDESIYDFSCRRFGKMASEILVDAAALGIFGGDIRKLSICSCFPFLVRWEQEKGSFFQALPFRRRPGNKKGLLTLQRGFGSLIEALAGRSGAEVVCNAPVEAVEPLGVRARGQFYPADCIIAALPGHILSGLLGLPCPYETADLSIVHMVYEGDVLKRKGFGYLVPTREKEILLGMIWDSAVFPQQNRKGETRVTAMMRCGGIQEAQEAMARHLGVVKAPIASYGTQASGAIPQFHVGYQKRLDLFVKEAMQKCPRLRLVGNYISGASVEACVSLSKKVATGLR